MQRTTYAQEGRLVWSWTERKWMQNPMVMDSNWFSDDKFYDLASAPRICNDIVLFPAIVSGFDDADWFEGWPGIGSSPVIYRMKAYVTARGEVVYHGTGRGGPNVLIETVCPVPERYIDFNFSSPSYIRKT